MTTWCDITEEAWQRVMPLLPELRPRAELRGRPLANTRAVLNGVLWVMHHDVKWSAMPSRFPSYQTCHRRFKVWHDKGVLRPVMAELFGDDGVALCASIEARMRKQVSYAEPAAGSQEPNTEAASGSVYASSVPQPFNHAALFPQSA